MQITITFDTQDEQSIADAQRILEDLRPKRRILADSLQEIKRNGSPSWVMLERLVVQKPDFVGSLKQMAEIIGTDLGKARSFVAHLGKISSPTEPIFVKTSGRPSTFAIDGKARTIIQDLIWQDVY